jgi:predicted NBD/HSP70 family sugar kinase
MGRSGDPSVLRRLNIAAVLRYLYAAQGGAESGSEHAGIGDNEGYTITEISRAAGISRPTAEDAVDTLIEEGWLVEVFPDPSIPPTTGRRPAGRPARRIRFDSMAGCVVGVDIAPHWVRALVADLAGNIIGRADYPVSGAALVASRIAAAHTAITEALRLADFDAADILAAAATTAGIVRADGHVVRSVIQDFTGRNLSKLLGPRIPVPISFANDMRASVLAEHWVGAAVGCSSAVYLHAGRRLGSAFLIDGTSPLGFHGGAGEIPPQSGERLVKAYRKLVSFTGVRLDGLTVEEILAIDPRTVFEAAHRGDDPGKRAVTEFADEFAQAVEGLVITVDPEVVVVGGGIITAGDIAAEAIHSRLAEVCVFEPRVVVSPLGETAAAMGAVRLALNEVEASLFANPKHPRLTAKEPA